MSVIASCSTPQACIRTSKTRRWGCATHLNARTGRCGNPATPTCPPSLCVRTRSGPHTMQDACTAEVSVLPELEREKSTGLEAFAQLQDLHSQPPHRQKRKLSWESVSTCVGVAAAASCLHAAPALADSAVQGAEQIAKELASSNSAIGMVFKLSQPAARCCINVQ